jgi:hypothetical protein
MHTPSTAVCSLRSPQLSEHCSHDLNLSPACLTVPALLSAAAPGCDLQVSLAMRLALAVVMAALTGGAHGPTLIGS